MVHHVPIGIFARIGRWFADFMAVPGRIRKLAEQGEFESDKRLVCTSCGTGHVGNFRKVPAGEWGPNTVGACDNCKTQWVVNDAGTRLFRIA